MAATRHLLVGEGTPIYRAWKGLDETLDFGFDWSRLLRGDTISSSVWTVPDGLTQPSASSTSGERTTVWLAGGGAAGRIFEVRNAITTAAGRIYQRVMRVEISE